MMKMKIISREITEIRVRINDREWWNSPIRKGMEIIRFSCNGRRSRQYYRNEDNIMTSLQDGLQILKTGIIISDEDWNGFKKGEFKDYFREDWKTHEERYKRLRG
jgi:hypothetical protein